MESGAVWNWAKCLHAHGIIRGILLEITLHSTLRIFYLC